MVLDSPQVLMASNSLRVPTPSTSAVYSARSNDTYGVTSVSMVVKKESLCDPIVLP